MEIVKNVCLYILLGLLVSGFCHLIDSEYLSTFLHAQIITICITLIAITSAVRGIILGKLVDLSKVKLYRKINFNKTFSELKISIYEQVVMIIIALISLIIYGSKRLPYENLNTIKFIIDSILSSILFYNIYILFDTGIAIINIFISIDASNKTDEECD